MQWVFDCVWMGHEDNPHHPIAVPTMHFQLCCWGSSQCSKGGRAWQKAAQMETTLRESDPDPRAGVQRGSSQGDLSGTRAACEFVWLLARSSADGSQISPLNIYLISASEEPTEIWEPQSPAMCFWFCAVSAIDYDGWWVQALVINSRLN